MIGERLKNLRKNMGYTQDDLAEKLSISRSSLSLYEIDKRDPDSETFNKIADFFHVSLDYLNGRTDDPTPVRDINQDLYDEHDYTAELKSLIDDEEFRTEFLDFEDWTDEEKRNILFAIRANRALREKNEKN
ncbi:helix-turn-helix domain-containing protein [Acetobacterium wieringae]|uniref:helix-turn-helix domain-containing protein n=1 Tax=Acetobacterium wieringae TaxID=52694 RepID=UPI0020343E68|nr:helix-turn-helix transcriptional regulator [Acetobacterium wieringae]URN85826.1 helix-turn-helix transcriptional regulator [Acetobacterium wieringae]